MTSLYQPSAFGNPTAAQLATLAPLAAVLTADAPGIASNTTLSPVSGLSVAVPAGSGAIFDVLAWILYEAGTTGDIRTALTFPAGAALPWAKVGYTTALAFDEIGFANPTSGTSFFASGGNGAGAQLGLLMVGTLIMGSTAGAVGVSAAQNASDTVATIIKRGSRLTLRQIA